MQGSILQGSIRVLVGLILVMGGVGGIENDTSNIALPMAPLMISIAGLAMMAWGARAANKGSL